MGNYLDIIVPHYNEPNKMMLDLLTSINRQKKVNFKEIGIIIVDDHSDNKINKDLFKRFPNLSIKVIKNETNLGPGLTRQVGIDNSKAEYITFVDFDDELYSDDSLAPIINGLKERNNVNVLFTSVVQESIVDGKVKRQLLSSKQFVSLHGLFIRRLYLIEKNISFHKNLFYSEDDYFTTLLTRGRKYDEIGNATYIWKYNPESMTMKKRKYFVTVERYEDFKNCRLYAYEHMLNSGNPSSQVYIVQEVIGLIQLLTSNLFDFPELNEKREAYEREIYDFIESHNEFKEYTIEKLDEVYEIRKKQEKIYTPQMEITGSYSSFLNKFR